MNDEPEPDPEFYQVARVAQIFDVKRETVREWIAKGRLQSVKIDGRHFVTVESVRKLARGDA